VVDLRDASDTVVAAVLGGGIALFAAVLTAVFTASAGRRAKSREQRILFLTSAYRSLLSTAWAAEEGVHMVREIEAALVDTMLYGSRREVRLARAIADQFTQNGTAEYASLVFALRRGLRQELGVRRAKQGEIFIRMRPPSSAEAPPEQL
jgi:hypothetical protein